MANNSRINPMYADTAGGTRLVNDSTEIMISSIAVYNTAETFACILKDGAGNVIYSNNILAIPFSPSVPFKVTGLVVDTLTNCVVYIYTTP